MSNEYGMFATIYIELEEINNININNILNKIKNSCQERKPFIIYKDSKYKSTCFEWNNNLNTVCNISEF